MKHRKSLLLLLALCALLCTGCSVQKDYLTPLLNGLGSFSMPPKPAEVESMDDGRYAYAQLTQEEQKVYDEILDTVLNQKEEATLSTCDAGIIKKAFACVNADYGELFWIDGYRYTEYKNGDKTAAIVFCPKYTMNQEERQTAQEQVDAKVEQLLGGISTDDSDYQKARFVFDSLVNTVSYDKTAPNNQNILSVFLEGRTVCQGYACATQYLLNLLNIQNAIVTGSANGEPHAWNLVCLDGAYYYMDTTWGNSSYLNETSEKGKYINYNYFAVTSEELFLTHSPDLAFELPECSAVSDSYFVQEGRYFSDWKPDEIGQLCAQIDEKPVLVKFADEALYLHAKKYFIDEYHLSDYYEDTESVYYLEDELLCVLTFDKK